MNLLEAFKKHLEKEYAKNPNFLLDGFFKRLNLCKHRYFLTVYLQAVIKKKQGKNYDKELRKLSMIFFQPFSKIELEIDGDGNKRLGLSFKK